MLKIPQVRYNSVGIGEIRASGDKVGWQSHVTKQVTMIQTKEINKMECLRINNTMYMVRIYMRDRTSHMFQNLKASDVELLESHLSRQIGSEVPFMRNDDRLASDGRHWGELNAGDEALIFTMPSRSDSADAPLTRFSVPNDIMTNVTPAGKADLQIELEEPLEHYEGDYVQELRFWVPPLDGVNQAEELHLDLMEKCKKGKDAQSLIDFGNFKFLQPSARYEVQLFPEIIRLHGRSFDHCIKYKDIRHVFVLPTARAEMYVVFSLLAPLRQGQTSFAHVVMQMNNSDTIDATIRMGSVEELLEKKLSASGKVSGYAYDVLAMLLQTFGGRTIIHPCKEFKSDNGKHCVGCTYRQSMGLLYPLEKGFLYGPRPLVFLSYQDVAYVSITPPVDGTRSFDVDVKANSGQLFEFSRIERANYPVLVGFLRKIKVRLANEHLHENADGKSIGGGFQGVINAQQRLAERKQEKEEPVMNDGYSGGEGEIDDEDDDEDWVPDSPDSGPKEKRTKL